MFNFLILICIWVMVMVGSELNRRKQEELEIQKLKDKALEYTERLCLVYENSDKTDLKNIQKIIDNIYQHVHCVQENKSCYHVHENWREELRNQNWEI